MRRYAKVDRSGAGVTTVTVSLVDGDLSTKATVKSYVGGVKDATLEADRIAHTNLEALKQGLDATTKEKP